jgi:hypothetical protein
VAQDFLKLYGPIRLAGPDNFSGDVQDIYVGDLNVEDASYLL